jgi:SAM-dependent methyltransferase
VFLPLYEQMLTRLAPPSVLEVGCGTGHLSLMASSLGFPTTALEPSEGMHAEAVQVLRKSAATVVNARIEDFKEGPFGVVLSHLCAQTVKDVVPFFRACAQRLGMDGTFTFSIPHPCFYNAYKRLIPEAEYVYSRCTDTEVSFAITAEPGVVFDGVPYHHRPLSSYVAALKQAGLSVRELIEPWPSPAVQALYGRHWDTPRYCVFVCALGHS